MNAMDWSGKFPRLRRMFNLNDPRWGRDGDKPADASKPEGESKPNGDGRRDQQNAGPPDLEEAWRELSRKLGGMFGKQPPPPRPNGPGGSGGGFQPDMKSAGVGIGLVAGVVALIWLGTGFFIVQEGQQGVITQFGKYHSKVDAGLNWRLPYPIQRHDLVTVTQIRSVDVGRDKVLSATGLRESAMLTQDENIVDIKFAVQYRLSDARAFLFESKNPEDAVVQAAETAVREVVGKMRMDAALSEERDQIAPQVRALMQQILDRYNIGVEVVAINLQQGGVRPPEQVQAAFDDVLTAGQERERAKNEAQAYANQVVPGAAGTAARMKEESDAYKARVVAQAQGDAQRFRVVQAEYAKAPQVTRDRMYLDTMQQIYSNVTKVIVESRQGSSLLYLPLDKLLQTNGSGAGDASQPSSPPVQVLPPANVPSDPRSRDASRTRERDTR